MWVSDNGCGLAKPALAGASFGQQMIAAMVTRLSAEIFYVTEGGTRAEVICGAPTDRHDHS